MIKVKPAAYRNGRPTRGFAVCSSIGTGADERPLDTPSNEEQDHETPWKLRVGLCPGRTRDRRRIGSGGLEQRLSSLLQPLRQFPRTRGGGLRLRPVPAAMSTTMPADDNLHDALR